MFRKFYTVGVGILLILALAGCGGTVVNAQLPAPTTNLTDSETTLNSLRGAEVIELHKALISLGDHWNVKANGEDVAEVEGQFIAMFGDTYNMFSNEGNLVASEAEEIIRVLPGATLYDYNNEIRGGINQELTIFLSKYTIEDADGNTVGTAEQQLNFVLDFTIKNTADVAEYRVEKAFFSIGAQLTITRLVDAPTVDVQDVIWVAMIANELSEQSSQNNNNNNNRSSEDDNTNRNN